MEAEGRLSPIIKKLEEFSGRPVVRTWCFSHCRAWVQSWLRTRSCKLCSVSKKEIKGQERPVPSSPTCPPWFPNEGSGAFRWGRELELWVFMAGSPRCGRVTSQQNIESRNKLRCMYKHLIES